MASSSQPALAHQWDSSVTSKARKMQQKTVELQQRFNLPSSEAVVQDYYCTLKRPKFNHGGRIWVSQNHICYYSGLPFKIMEVISFRKVTKIERVPGKVLSNAIRLEVDEGKGNKREVVFGSFLKTTETLNVLQHLWNNPPTYIQLDSNDIGGNSPSSSNAASSSSGAGFARSGRGFGGGGGGTQKDGWDDYQQSQDQDAGGVGNGFWAQQQRVKVDVETSAQAVQTALYAREMGADTLNELSRQADVLDRIEHDVENLHANLDKADRQLRGLESFGGGLKNVMTRDKTKRNNPVFNRIDRTIHLKNFVPKEINVNILFKHEDDSLSPASLKFTENTFSVIDSESGKQEKGAQWTYTQIASIVMRARPLHMDVRFKDDPQTGKPVPRFRMMTSFCQPITNELFLRSVSVGNGAAVLFEPGIEQFHYGSYKLSLTPTAKDRKGNDTSGFGRASTAQGGTAVFRKKQKASDLLSANVDEETKRQMDLQEANVDNIISLAGDLQNIAHTMGEELGRGNEQLDRITQRAADATHRVHLNNHRVGNMLN